VNVEASTSVTYQIWEKQVPAINVQGEVQSPTFTYHPVSKAGEQFRCTGSVCLPKCPHFLGFAQIRYGGADDLPRVNCAFLERSVVAASHCNGRSLEVPEKKVVAA